MAKIAWLGDRESAWGFHALGIKIFPVEKAEKAKKILTELSGGNYALILMTEKLGQELSREIASLRELGEPLVLVLPDCRGSTGWGRREMAQVIKKALGMEISG